MHQPRLGARFVGASWRNSRVGWRPLPDQLPLVNCDCNSEQPRAAEQPNCSEMSRKDPGLEPEALGSPDWPGVRGGSGLLWEGFGLGDAGRQPEAAGGGWERQKRKVVTFKARWEIWFAKFGAWGVWSRDDNPWGVVKAPGGFTASTRMTGPSVPSAQRFSMWWQHVATTSA